MPVSQPRRAAEHLAAPTLAARGARWLFLGAATVGAVLLLQAASLPTPWLFGSLLVGVAYALGAARTSLRTPLLAGQISQAIVGVAFGFQMQASTLQAVVSSWLGVSFVVLGTLAVSLAAGIVVARLTGISQATAALGLVAGGAPGVVAMAEELRADARLVAFMQYLRVLVVVLVAPLAAYALLHGNAAGQAIPAPASERLAADLGLTAVSLLGGLLLARFARISAGTLIGPLLVAGALSASGLVGHAAVPEVLQDVAFAVIGLQVGLRFTIATIREAGRLLVWALASILAIVAVCAALAVVLVPLADVTYADAYLATTPGGLPAVLAASIGIGANAAFVASVQVLRVFVMILAAPPLVRLLARRVDTGRHA